MPLAAPLARELLRHTLPEFEARAKTLPLRLPEINAVLPEGGLPRSAVVEIAAPRGLSRSTSIALAACAEAQAEARLRGGGDATAGAWCAWIDPTGTLFAPAVARAGVDLRRLLVVRPPPEMLAKVAVRVALSRAFSVLVIDTCGVPGAWQGGASQASASAGAGRRGDGERARGGKSAAAPPSPAEDLSRWVNVVRKLALALEESDGTILLLTDRQAARPMPLPVAMRIELERVAEDRLSIRVAKDRRGRVTAPAVIPLAPEGAADARAAGAGVRPALRSA